MTELEKALISSGKASNEKEAKKMLERMKAQVVKGRNPEKVLFEIGLEPDYFFDLC